MTRLLIVIVLASLLSGCIALTGGKTVTKNRFNRERFEERPDRIVAVDGTANRIAMNIYQVPEVVQVNFPVNRETRILSLTLTEKERLNIDRPLLWDRDYVVDEDAGVLSVQFEFPAVYLLEPTVRFGLRLVTMDSRSKKVSATEKTLTFNWVPMKGRGDKTLTFEYTDLDKVRAQIAPRLQQEIKRTDIGRLSPSYADKVRLLSK